MFFKTETFKTTALSDAVNFIINTLTEHGEAKKEALKTEIKCEEIISVLASSAPEDADVTVRIEHIFSTKIIIRLQVQYFAPSTARAIR